MLRRAFVAGVVALWAGALVAQGAATTPRPGARDLCPVCGMLVSKYPNWVATIVYKDGHAHHFDGAKDMFKFWHEPAKYAAGHRREDMSAVWVTDFYDLKAIDARQAWYVIGSDVLGPMGHELIPLASQADAAEFLKEHKGRRMLRFGEVNKALPEQLDAGTF